ncbi:MAG: Clp protease N-terminal domain-containing protein, partial [Gemmatimonadota bacterium]
MIPADRLTIRAARALQDAAEAARRTGNPAVEDLHLLAALFDQEEGVVAPILRKVGAEPANVGREVAEGIERLPRQSGASPTLSRELNRVVDVADGEARDLGDEYVSTEHLLLALAGAEATSTSKILAAAGVTLEALREAL